MTRIEAGPTVSPNVATTTQQTTSTAPAASGPTFESVMSQVQERLAAQGWSLGPVGADSLTALAAALAQAGPDGAAKVARLLAAGARLDPSMLLALGAADADQPLGTAAVPGAKAKRTRAASAPIAGDRQQAFAQLKPLFQQAEQQTGVPWQIQAAQWALETGWGTATPKDVRTGRESYNLFGIKGAGPAGSVAALTTEVIGGQVVPQTDRFRAYDSYAESVLDHAQLLASPYYQPAHAAGQNLRAWTEMLGPQKLGYATDPQYSSKLWSIIRENGWDRG